MGAITGGWRRSRFFWALVALSIVTLIVALGQWTASHRLVARQSQTAASFRVTPAPDFRLPTPDGASLRLSDLRGQVVLLNFWATWCAPCKAEMPALNALQHEYGASQRFVVVGVNVGESREAVVAFAQQMGIRFPLVLDAESQVATGLYQARTLPATFIVDREGQIRDTWVGQIAEAAMLARLQRVW